MNADPRLIGEPPPPAARPLRVVMFLLNDATRDTRVLREAATLAAAGHAVTIVAWCASDSPLPREELRAGVAIRRVPAVVDWLPAWRERLGWLRRPWRARGWLRTQLAAALRRGPLGAPRLIGLLALAVLALPWVAYRLLDERLLGDRGPGPRPGGPLDRWVRWQRSIAAWSAAALAAAPDADVWHGHDLTGLPAAALARRRRGGRLVYDSHELFEETESHADLPRWVKARYRAVERREAAGADALVSVNRTLADLLAARLRPGRVVVVHNAPPRWSPPTPPPDLLRLALGLAPGTPLVLYHGGLTAERGLLPLADALLRPGLERAHLVYLGYGPLRDELAARAAAPAAGGRIHLLEAVPPEELAAWVASADVGAMPNRPSNANEILSTPNKLFESIAAGLPVVSSDFPERRRIVLGDPAGPLGALCDPTDVGSIADALRSVFDLGPEARAALRARVLLAARERWNWETEGARLTALYDALAAATGSGQTTGGATAAGTGKRATEVAG